MTLRQGCFHPTLNTTQRQDSGAFSRVPSRSSFCFKPALSGEEGSVPEANHVHRGCDRKEGPSFTDGQALPSRPPRAEPQVCSEPHTCFDSSPRRHKQPVRFWVGLGEHHGLEHVPITLLKLFLLTRPSLAQNILRKHGFHTALVSCCISSSSHSGRTRGAAHGDTSLRPATGEDMVP